MGYIVFVSTETYVDVTIASVPMIIMRKRVINYGRNVYIFYEPTIFRIA